MRGLDLVALCIGLLRPPATADTLPEIRISVAERRLWVIGSNRDTLYTAPVAVGSGLTLHTPDRAWRFTTPTGWTRVRAKEVDPVWVPPDWHYFEVARKLALGLGRLSRDSTSLLNDGSRLSVRGAIIGVLSTDSVFHELPASEEIIFDGTLFIPPFGTRNRLVRGQLGPYRLLLANGVGLHGTPFKDSIGKAVTHGCIRLHDEDITWLYENIPVGARVLIS